MADGAFIPVEALRVNKIGPYYRYCEGDSPLVIEFTVEQGPIVPGRYYVYESDQGRFWDPQLVSTKLPAEYYDIFRNPKWYLKHTQLEHFIELIKLGALKEGDKRTIITDSSQSKYFNKIKAGDLILVWRVSDLL